jgi:DNA invertase Pin-like site-specific DNA recombinase
LGINIIFEIYEAIGNQAMRLGYCRSSTAEQVAGLEAQQRELEAFGVDKIYSEKVSSVGKRPKLDALLEDLRSGDVLVVTKLDRLARSVRHFGVILDTIKIKGASLIIITMGKETLDTSTATGQLLVTMMVAVAEFERSIMLERQLDGIAKAKAEGKYKGRVPTAQMKKDSVLALVRAGVPRQDICKQLGISQASYYRVIK